MSAVTSAAPGQFDRRRQQFRAWRGARPFWAGLFILFSGFPIAYFPYANLQVGHLTLAMATTAGAGSLIIGVLLGVLGLSLWFQKHIRVFAGVAAILLGLVSIPVSNLGGFFIGFLFALIGGAMAVSWAPGGPAPAPAAKGADLFPVGAAPAAPAPVSTGSEGTAPVSTDSEATGTGTDDTRPAADDAEPDAGSTTPEAGAPAESAPTANSSGAGVALTKDAEGADEPNDLSGTSPANGANGRHSAG